MLNEKNKQTLESRDPVTAELIFSTVPSTTEDVTLATEKALAAKDKWLNIGIGERQKIIEKYCSLLKMERESFAELISKETGKPLWESLGEVDAMIGKIAISIDAQNTRCPTRESSLATGLSITRHKPLGVLGVLGPFNFPGHLPNGHIIPAILAGNTIIFKPSEQTPAVGDKLVKTLHEAGVPRDVVQIVQGGPEIGKALALEQRINGLLFTGSWHTGQALSHMVADHPDKLLALEMGGNNPLIVNNIDDIDAAVYTIILSAYQTSGQRCTCARRLILPKTKNRDAILRKLQQTIPHITVGHYKDRPQPFMGSLINQKTATQLIDYQSDMVKKGAKIVIPAKLIKEGTPLVSPGLLDITDVHQRDDNEHFGPLLHVILVDTLEEAIAEANNTAYGLSAGILSQKREDFDLCLDRLQAGLINWNTPLTGASSSAPFGGIGKSGNYRPSAYYAADYCNYPVASLEKEQLSLPQNIAPGLNIFNQELTP